MKYNFNWILFGLVAFGFLMSWHYHVDTKSNFGLRKLDASILNHLSRFQEELDGIRLYLHNASRLLKRDTNVRNNFNIKRDIHLRQMKKQKENMNNAISESGRAYFQSHWEPSWKCEFEERIGNFGDGGKWVCDANSLKEKKGNCHIISIGSNNDFSFEVEVHNYFPQCKISVFDHTVSNPSPPPYVDYFSFGLGSENNLPIITLETAFQKAGVSPEDGVDILKIDCEGCEYDVYPQFISTKYFISQILIEIHFRNSASVHKMFQSLTSNNYVVFHKESNTIGCSGDCVEYGFLRLNLNDM
jgi:hypothetical protein